jgi:hypothetical protein
MRDPFKNPFSDPDRREIWEMLLARDSDAFAARDWAAVDGDFIREQFEGISCNASDNPDDWKLKYPRLEDYRDDWLRMAETFLKLPLECGTHRDLVFKLSRLEEIEIGGDIAICHKKFSVDEPLKDGRRYQIAAQTLYRVRRAGGRWKIAGFVGYLPYDPAPKSTPVAAAAKGWQQ